MNGYFYTNQDGTGTTAASSEFYPARCIEIVQATGGYEELEAPSVREECVFEHVADEPSDVEEAEAPADRAAREKGSRLPSRTAEQKKALKCGPGGNVRALED
jgi:hypothetical protein